jgi:hypothetical protein
MVWFSIAKTQSESGFFKLSVGKGVIEKIAMRRDGANVFRIAARSATFPLFHWPWFIYTGNLRIALCHVAG